ncbi:VOC family protein [Luteimonas saliphila]|uniref:VOC family protein n=1 Tax=Luteimonas saliphila TaxID=2804919 RepID=UPI00192DF425|nr:VOC family protein [Luteimonas saliphila]
MFNHIVIGSNDIERSLRFYNAVLGILGVPEPVRQRTATGHERLFYRHDDHSLGITQPINGEPATVANGSTLGFRCASPEQVQAFHDTAVAAGGTSIEDPPGPREGGSAPMHLAYVRDPDGNKLCAVYRPR